MGLTKLVELQKVRITENRIIVVFLEGFARIISRDMKICSS